jgi:hypothetical protein
LHFAIERALKKVMPPRKTPHEPTPSAGTAKAADPAELERWLAEGKRLFAEAEARVESGEFLPALSSLAALPPLHRMLCEHLSDLAHPARQGDQTAPCGMYL